MFSRCRYLYRAWVKLPCDALFTMASAFKCSRWKYVGTVSLSLMWGFRSEPAVYANPKLVCLRLSEAVDKWIAENKARRTRASNNAENEKHAHSAYEKIVTSCNRFTSAEKDRSTNFARGSPKQELRTQNNTLWKEKLSKHFYGPNLFEKDLKYKQYLGK